MSIKAFSLLKEAEVVVGYKTYIKLIESILSPEQKTVSTGMGKELERAKKAINLALEGKKVAVVSSGDPGVYGMAGLVLELAVKKEDKLEVEIVPGVTAANAGASLLGAPLMHDYAVISLSDLLTPWEQIKKRLTRAAQADFITVLYNPKSKGRTEQIKKAREIFLKHRSGDTPVGIVRAVSRKGEEVVKTNLEEMLNHKIDMLSTVIIGNSTTYQEEEFMITPRGYKL